MDNEEAPWYTSPPDAWIHWDEEATIGFLYFKSPKDGSNECVPVTTGDAQGRSEQRHSPVWHIEPMMYGGIATVSPSIHGIGRFHSPNPVQFRITKVTRGN